MSATLPISRARRLAQAAPVLAAAAIYGLGQDRWVLAGPMFLAICAAVAFRFEVPHTTRLLLGSGGIGAGLGLLLGFISPPWSPYMPAPLQSALCAGVAALAIFCLCSRSVQYAAAFAWILAVISTDIHVGTLPLELAEVALALATLAVAMVEAQAFEAGPLRALLGFSLFVGFTIPGAIGLGRLAEASVEPVLGFVMRLAQKIPHPHGLGIDSEVRIRKVSLVADDDTVLFEATQPVPARLRSVVFDQFDGETWRTSRSLSATRAPLPGGGERTTAIQFAEEVGPFLPSPGGLRSVRGLGVEMLGAGVARAQGALRGAEVELGWDPIAGPSAEAGEEALEIPADLKAQLLPFARTIVGKAKTAREQAVAIEGFFAENFEYSLTTDLSGPGNPLVRLIRDRPPAYCIYFASAAAALLRSLGVSARLVGGFVPGEANPLTGRVAVQARHAHAWIEAYLPEEGRFVPFDPTPWRSRDRLTPPPSSLGLLWEAIRSAFRRRYLEAGGTPGRALMAVFRSRITWGLFALLVLARLGQVRWRTRPARRESAAQAADERLRQAYRSYLGLIKARGIQLPGPSESDGDFLRRLQREAPEAAAAATRFVARYQDARFGAASIPEDAWQAELGELQRALEAQPPPHR